MSFVAVKNNAPLFQVSGCSDVIHIEGIGGYGHNWLERHGAGEDVFNETRPSGWLIDCLPNGLLRLFPSSHKMIVGASLSSLEIWAIHDNP